VLFALSVQEKTVVIEASGLTKADAVIMAIHNDSFVHVAGMQFQALTQSGYILPPVFHLAPHVEYAVSRNSTTQP
jgi:hypothetical protein